jgi:glycosyltransferase involved in cell wall biosynthesis
MRIVMFTNTFTPHVGGVARSVAGFAAEHRRCGHEVLVVAPEFPGSERREEGVVRVPAIQRFNATDFSVPVPVPGRLKPLLDAFRPEVVHSHHPFLLGDTALRVAAGRGLPIVFTHHTLYERYTHYVPGDWPALRRAAIELAVGYCNLCNAVVAPSESVAGLLRRRGVKAPIEAIPTGVETEVFAAGDRTAGRRLCGVPDAALLVGHVGRLAPEKNLGFLARAVARFLLGRPGARFLVAGDGPSAAEIRRIFTAAGLAGRLHAIGVLARRSTLADVYAAMDVFAFASQSETQGMVLTEAMAAGVPAVAVDAPGVREVVADGENGRLLPDEDEEDFAAALAWLADLPAERRRRLSAACEATARRFSLHSTAERCRALYARLLGEGSPPVPAPEDDGAWPRARRRLAEEWRIWRNVGHAAAGTLRGGGEPSG